MTPFTYLIRQGFLLGCRAVVLAAERVTQPASFRSHISETAPTRRVADVTGATTGLDLGRDPIDKRASPAVPEFVLYFHPGMQETKANKRLLTLALERGEESQVRDSEAGPGVSEIDNFAAGI